MVTPGQGLAYALLALIVTLQVALGIVWAALPVDVTALGCLLWSHHADRYLDWHLRNYPTKRAALYARERAATTLPGGLP